MPVKAGDLVRDAIRKGTFTVFAQTNEALARNFQKECGMLM